VIRLLRQLELLFNTRVDPPPSAARKLKRVSKRIVKSGNDSRRRVAKSDEFLMTVWRNLRTEFFPGQPEIDDYTVCWSSRPQKRVLASCNIRRKKVVVARELFQPSASRWISAVLYHEMCHAVIGEGVHLSQSGKRLWHGRQFRQLEALHPDIAAMNTWISTGGWAIAVHSYRVQLARRSKETSR
jgi:hypothetical protein